MILARQKTIFLDLILMTSFSFALLYSILLETCFYTRNIIKSIFTITIMTALMT